MKYVLIFLLVTSCQLMQKKSKQEKKQNKQFQSLKREGDLGKRVAVRILKKYPRLEQAQVQNYISSLGRSIVVRTGRQELYYYFAVLNSEEKKSFAAPGGFVFVTTGLIKSLNEESQLAGVLAKEIANINRMFLFKAAKKSKKSEEAVEMIYKKLVSNSYQQKEKRAADYEAIMGLLSMKYNTNTYPTVAGDREYATRLASQLKNTNSNKYSERFRQLKNRL